MDFSKNEMLEIRSRIGTLKSYHSDNNRNKKYFEGKVKPRPLGIAVPPSFQGVSEGVSWVRSGVTAVSDRVNFLGFDREPKKAKTADKVNEILNKNGFFSDFSTLVQDSLVFGCSFVVIGKGDKSMGEPNTLITIESPNNISVEFHRRTRRVKRAVHYVLEKSKTKAWVSQSSKGPLASNENGYGTYYTEKESIPFIVKDGEILEDPDFARGPHGFSNCPVVFVPNSSTVGGGEGRSEITRPCRDIVDSTLRTLQNLEISAEFHAAPQKLLFTSEDSVDDSTMDAINGSINQWMVFRDENAKVQVLQGNDPTPFIDQINLYRMEYANASGTPEGYLSGFSGSGNPTSADSINAQESRLNKRSDRYIDSISVNLKTIAGFIMESEEMEQEDITPTFAPVNTMSFGSISDGLTKLISAGTLQSDSEYVYKLLGMGRDDRNLVRREAQSAQASSRLQDLLSREISNKEVSDKKNELNDDITSNTKPLEKGDE